MRAVIVAAALSWGAAATAEMITAESAVEQVAVLELYTSHGCSSCPPADAWLRGLVDHPGLWRDVVPLAFHVDYWDRLGWPDRFARAEFSRRQREYQDGGALSSVYTPGFILRGSEWRGWFVRKNPDFSPGQPVGRLQLEASPGESARVRFASAGQPRPLTAHLAVLGFGLESAIGRGENAGRSLREDFVVLGVSHGKAIDGAAVMQWQLPWPQIRAGNTSRLAVAVWVSAPDHPRPVQAAGSWLPQRKR